MAIENSVRSKRPSVSTSERVLTRSYVSTIGTNVRSLDLQNLRKNFFGQTRFREQFLDLQAGDKTIIIGIVTTEIPGVGSLLLFSYPPLLKPKVWLQGAT